MTPHANVDVDIKIYIFFFSKRLSTKSLSPLHNPAWWIAIPLANSSFRSADLISSYAITVSKIFFEELSSLMNLDNSSFENAISFNVLAVLTVSFLEWTNTKIYDLVILSITFSYKISFVNNILLIGFFSLIPIYYYYNGTGL